MLIWPEFAENQDFYPDYAENPRILRFPCGGDCFLEKEKLWPHMPAFIDAMLDFYGEALPDVATGHYADGGYCAVLTKAKTGTPFTFTGHSLGAQKLEKLGTNTANWLDMEARYCFSHRIAAERMSMTHAARIIVSTSQEQEEQYAHSLYAGAVDASDNQKFAVTPPGVNQRIFAMEATQLDNNVSAALDARFGADRGPCTVVSSRLDEKKNIIGVVKAYAGNADLRRRAALVLCVRGIDDPETDIVKLGSAEKKVLREILDVINQAAMGDRVHFLNIGSQLELAATYRYFARRSSVFALTSFYEPFGLASLRRRRLVWRRSLLKTVALQKYSKTAPACSLIHSQRITLPKDCWTGCLDMQHYRRRHLDECRKPTPGVKQRRDTFLLLTWPTQIICGSLFCLQSSSMKPRGSRIIWVRLNRKIRELGLH